MAEKATVSEHLVIQTAFLGDLLLGIPLLKNLRQLEPGDKITLLCRRGLGGFMLATRLVDEVIEVDKKDREDWRSAVAKLKARKFDWLICPHESPRSTWLARALQAERKVGYRHLLSFLAFHHRVRRPLELPEALRQLALLEPFEPEWRKRLDQFAGQQEAAGGQGPGGELLPVPAWASMEIPALKRIRNEFERSHRLDLLSTRAAEIASKLLEVGKPLAFLAPGSVWATKMWKSSGFAETGRILSGDGYQIVLIGAAAEKELCERIAADIPGAAVVAGTSLFESAELLSLATLFIGNDSGATHLAAAAGVPTVAVFGPTVLEFGYRPWQSRAKVVQVPRVSLRCRPCGKHGSRACPVGTHECMAKIDAITVVEAARSLVSTHR